MSHGKLEELFLDQSNDLIWMVDADLLLTYANQAYLDLMKHLTGKEKKLNESVLVEGFGEGYIEKWTGYYKKALSGDYFEIEEHYSHPETNEIQYGQIIFNPIRDENNQVVAVACQSRDITRIVKQRSDAHQLMDASLDVFCTINEAGNFIFVSEAATKHWGYTPQELIGKPYVSFIIEEDIPKTNDIANAILNGEEIKSFVNRYKRKDGAIAYNQWSARWDSESKLMYSVARDAKEKIEQETLLHESEQRFKALVQEGADLIAILDADGTYRYVSPTSFTVLGMQPEEFLGRSPFEFIHPDDAERTMASLQKITEQQKVHVEPFRFRNNKNEWRWIETVLTNMMDNPAVGGIVANSRDITAKKAEEQRLKLLESVITNTNDAVLITEAEPLDEPGPFIIYVNDAFTKMTGYTAEEVFGKSPRMLQGPKTDKAELARLSKALRNWQPCEITIINYKKNGDEFWINLSVSPVADKNGWYTHWISIERDVTEQKVKQRERELLTDISLNFNRENDFGNACKGLCQTIGVFGGFDWVELWTINMERSKVKYTSHYLQDISHEVFYAETQGYQSFEMGSGLAGQIWQKKKQVFWNTSDDSKDFIRKEAAKKINLKTVWGIPLINQDEVIGVLFVGSKHGVETLEKYAGLFVNFQTFIGSEINRKKLENDLSHLYESIPDIVCVADFQGRFFKMNPSGCHLLGYTEEEILYHNIDEFVFSADKDITAQEIAKLGKGQSVSSFENRYVQKSGEICWLSWTANVNIQDGLIYATARNITAEKKLRELSTNTSKMARIGSWEVDMVNNSLFWSDITYEIHETSENFMPQLSEAINFYRDDFRELVTEVVNACIETGTPFDFEAIIVTGKNNEVWVRSIGRAEMVNGKCTRIYGSFQDINTRKVAELNQLKLIEEKTNILESIGDAFYALDGELNFTYMNTSCANLLAVKKEKIIGKNLFTEFPDLKNTLFEDELRKVQHTAEATKFEFYYVPFDAWFDESIYPTPAGISVYFADITQRKKANAEIAKSEEKRRLIMNGALDAIISMDSNGTISFWNPQSEVIFGWKAEEVIGKPLSEMIIPEHFRKYHVEGLKNYLQTGEGKIINALLELSAIRKNGEEFPIELTVIPIKQAGEEFFCAFVRDITERKRSEEKLTESEQKYRLLALQLQLQQVHLTNAQEVAKVGSWETDLSNLKLTWSDETYRIFGTDRESFETTHENFLNYVHPDDREKVDKALKDSTQADAQTQHRIEHRIVTASGEAKVVEEHWKVTFGDKGEPLMAIGSCQDITGRKKAEETILQANERFEKVTEATNDVIWDWDIESGTFSRSNAIDNFLGVGTSRILEKKDFWNDNFHREDISKIKSSVQKALEDPDCNRWEEEYRILNNKNEIIFVIDRGLILRNKNGKAIRMVGAMTDITEQKKSAEENRFKANLLSTIGQAAIATNLDGVVNYWNKAAEIIYGWTREEAIGKNIMLLTTPDTSEEQAKEIMEGLKKGEGWSGEFNVKKKDGTIFPALITNSPIFDEHNRLTGIIGISSDITQEVKNKELLKSYTLELERSNEELEQFAFIASHDLQEPLRMISSFMDQLKRKYGDRLDEKGLQYIYFATDGAKRMKQIILDLLLYSRANRPTDQNDWINLNEIVAEYTQLRRKAIAEKKATITFHGLPSIETYRAPITQIFHCLLDNALKYVDENKSPSIEIDAIEKENVWQFAIKDNGVGIDPKFFNKIFIIFQRLQNRKADDGTGIGLAIAKRSVEFLGGKIWVESEIDKGSTFYFTISKIKQLT